MRWRLGVAAALVALVAVDVAQACVRKVRWELQPPYGVILPSGERSGYFAELTTEALARLGCTTVLVELPWARGLRELEEGRIDLVPGALESADRQRFARFSRPINLSPNLLFLSAEASRRVSLAALADLRDTDLKIAVEPGSRYSNDYAQLMRDPRFVQRLHLVQDRSLARRMMLAGRVDGMISDQVAELVSGIPLKPDDNDPRPVLVVSSSPDRIAFSRQTTDADFVKRFDAAINAMIEDGTLIRLRERYMPCDTDPDTLGCRVDMLSSP